MLDGLRIYNNTLIVPTHGAWENGMAPGHLRGVPRHGHEELRNLSTTRSTTPSPWPARSRGTRHRIHHNFFNLGWGRYAYAIEASMSDLEIDHNHFFGGLYPIALWGGNPQNHNIHHNLFEGACAGGFVNRELLNYTSPITNLRFINNTIIDNGGIGRIFALHASSTYEARNNLIIRTLDPRTSGARKSPARSRTISFPMSRRAGQRHDRRSRNLPRGRTPLSRPTTRSNRIPRSWTRAKSSVRWPTASPAPHRTSARSNTALLSPFRTRSS